MWCRKHYRKQSCCLIASMISRRLANSNKGRGFTLLGWTLLNSGTGNRFSLKSFHSGRGLCKTSKNIHRLTAATSTRIILRKNKQIEVYGLIQLRRLMEFGWPSFFRSSRIAVHKSVGDLPFSAPPSPQPTSLWHAGNGMNLRGGTD